MNSLVSMNAETLGEQLGVEINDATVLIAKNIILGNTPEGCAEILGVSESEIQELMETTEYKNVHLILASHHNHQQMETSLSWDDVERKALQLLGKRMDSIKDVGQLIQIASMANRAVRRQVVPDSNNTLDPSKAGQTVQLTLTKRMVEALNGTRAQETSAQISIKGGHANPSFKQVQEFLTGDQSKPPRFPENYKKPGEDGVTLDQLLESMKK